MSHSGFLNEETLERIAPLGRLKKMMLDNGIQTHGPSGRRYFTGYSYNTLFDWDQYFDAIVQIYAGIGTEYIRNGVLIFLDNQEENGFILRAVRPPEYRMVEEEIEHVKPFLAQIAWLVWQHDCDLDWIDGNYYQKLKKSVLFWFNEKDPGNLLLPVWNSGPHTGMDNHHERAGYWNDCYGRGVDLASYLYRECIAFSLVAKQKNEESDRILFETYAAGIKSAVNLLMWDEAEGMYFDIDSRTGSRIPYRYAGTFAPLWAGIASPEQAQKLVHGHLLNEQEFWRPFPVPATAATEKNYVFGHAPGDLGCSWRAHTWIPSNYYIMHGIYDYGFTGLAKELALKTKTMVEKSGDWEYYGSEEGVGCGLHPFWGWSLLAYFMDAELEAGLDPTRLG